MKQATVKLPSGEYCFSNFPQSGDAQMKIFNQLLYIGYSMFGSAVFSLEHGSWQLLGADPVNLTEEEAGEIVEQVTVEINVPLRSGGPLRYGMFKNYTTDDQFNFACPVATLSIDSLAASLGISKPYVVLKNINDDNT